MARVSVSRLKNGTYSVRHGRETFHARELRLKDATVSARIVGTIRGQMSAFEYQHWTLRKVSGKLVIHTPFCHLASDGAWAASILPCQTN